MQVQKTMNNKSKTNTTNTILNVTEMYSVFTDAVNGRVCKLNYSDAKSQPYCGYDDFSVNMKKSSYNVYMSANNAVICQSVDDTIVVDDNLCDTTKKQLRSKLVKFTDTELLKKCINAVTDAKFVNA